MHPKYSPLRKARPPHTEVGLFALLFAPPPQPCNPSAPHFSYLTCNISKKAKIFARTPTFASSKQNPYSPAPRRKVFATAHRDRAPYAPQQNTVNHSFLNSQNLHAMIYNAFEALKAFYRTTVVPLHFGKHRTFNLHTLPALLLIPYLI